MRRYLLAPLACACLNCSSGDVDRLKLPSTSDSGAMATGSPSTPGATNNTAPSNTDLEDGSSEPSDPEPASQTSAVASDCTQNLGCTLEALPSTGDPYQDCVDRINQFRTECACLEPLQRWTEAEACADQQAEYDSTRSAHAGFSNGICDAGNAQNECPGWRSVDQVIDRCLQSMWDEGPPPQDPCNGQCFQDHGHFLNMSSTRSTRVACGFFETPGGEVWSVQNFGR